MLKTIRKPAFRAKALTAAAAVILSVALPQLFHLLGLLSGSGAAPGAAFLPMHLPVMLAGLLAGPAAGVAVGALSPVLSFAISGMPTAAPLPFMTIELAVYGFVGGLLSGKRGPAVLKVLAVQLAGRAARALAVLAAVYVLGSGAAVSSIWTTITAGLPGIVLQLAVVPLLVYRLNGLRRFYE